MKNQHHRIADKLSDWFTQNARDLPFRKRYLPYEVLISELMLQQTQIKTALPFYQRWMVNFPNIQSLAKAKESEVMHLWQGLGYYARARNLHKLAKLVCEKFDGNIPEHFEKLITLPGLGPYSAGAIASIAFNQKNPAIDGNVRRVLSRVYCLKLAVNQKKSEDFFYQTVIQLLEYAKPRIINQALMELGALICSPKNPACSNCPIQTNCLASQKNQIHLYPKIIKKQINKTTLFFYLVQNNERKISLIPAENIKKNERVSWWKGLYSLPFETYPTHLTQKEIKQLEELVDQSAKLKKNHQGRFSISNHQVNYLLYQVSSDWLNNKFQKKFEYFDKNEIKNIPISSQSKKILNDLGMN